MTSQCRTLVQIQRRVDATDELGQPVNDWTTFAVVWADVRHSSGVESTKADAEVGTVRASVRIRWRQDVTNAMRVLAGGAVYKVQAVLPDLKRRQHLDLVCEVAQ